MAIYKPPKTLSVQKAFIKRSFDITLSIIGLAVIWWLILLAWLVASLDTRTNGFFLQKRIGLQGCIFHVIKIRTMRPVSGINTTVTTHDDPRITAIGHLFRRFKIDELPQLFNVLVGDMSFVGPRPDVPGFADTLTNEDRLILTVRPGITGPASLKYKAEEALLARQEDPENYNREVIFPDKVRINIDYVENWTFRQDLYYLWRTAFGS